MITEKLTEALKQAMKNRDETAVSTIRMLLAAIKNREIEKRGQLDDAEALKVLLAEKKKHLDSIAQFEQGGRADLAEKEKSEVRIIEKYLPVALDERELLQIVTAAAAAAGGDFGRAMKAAMAACGGRAEGAKVSAMVKQALNKK